MPGTNLILKAFLRQLLSVSAIRISATGLMLFNYLLFARLYPAEDLGLYLIVLGIATTLGTLISLGIPDGIVPLISSHRLRLGLAGLNHTVVMTSLVIVAVIAVVAIAVPGALVVADRAGWTPPARLHVWISVAGAGAYALLFLFSQALLALGRPRAALALFYCPNSVALMATLLAVWTVFPKAPVEVLLVALPVAWLAGAAVCAAAVFAIVRQGPRADDPHWSRSITTGLPMLGTRTVANLDAWSPVWMAGLLLSVHDAGVFGAAARLISGLMAIPQAVWFVSRATFAQLISRDDLTGLENFARLLASSVGGLLAVIALICWTAGDTIMALGFGSDYTAGGIVLALFTTGFALQFLTGGTNLMLLMGGRERFVLAVNAVFVPLLLLALAAGFYFYGMAGGAAGFVAVRSLKFGFLLLAIRSIFGFWSVPTLSRSRLAHGAVIFAPSGNRQPSR